MAENTLLEALFPDLTVRGVIQRVEATPRGDGTALHTSFTILDENLKRVAGLETTSCFGYLYREIVKCRKEAVFLHYQPRYVDAVQTKNRIRWLEMGIEVGVIPHRRDPKTLVKEGITIDLTDPSVGVASLYMLLTFFRWLRESPELVNGVIDLVDNAGRDFWASVAFCHYNKSFHLDQTLLPFQGTYTVGEHPETSFRDLGIVLQLHRVASDPLAVDNRLYLQEVDRCTKTNDIFYWNWHRKTLWPSKRFVLADRLMLLSSEVYPIIACGGFKQADKLVQELKEQSKNVKFT